MVIINIFDLHSDALDICEKNNTFLNYSKLKTRITDVLKYENRIQAYAIFIKDDIIEKKCSPLDLFFKQLNVTTMSEYFLKDKINHIDFKKNNFKEHYFNYFLTVENLKMLEGNIENISILKKSKIKMASLTWNGENELGFGHFINKSLKKFGKECVIELEKNNIIIDVSHISEKGFFDIINLSKNPIVASHSNSYSVCNNTRNLSDEQFKIIKNKNGIVGLNFHYPFLSDDMNSEKNGIKFLIKHIEYFLSLNGEHILCLGSDFDGGLMPIDLKNSFLLENLANSMLKLNYSENIVNDILYNNAMRFFQNNFQINDH